MNKYHSKVGNSDSLLFAGSSSAWLRESPEEIKELEQRIMYKNKMYVQYIWKKHIPLNQENELQVRDIGRHSSFCLCCFYCVAEYGKNSRP